MIGEGRFGCDLQVSFALLSAMVRCGVVGGCGERKELHTIYFLAGGRPHGEILLVMTP